MNPLSHISSPNRKALLQATLDSLSSQWANMNGEASTAPEIIDPEALLLASSNFARHDARLFSVMLDWLLLNGKSINIQRIINIRKTYPLGNVGVILALAEKLSKESSSMHKWKSLTATKLNAPSPSSPSKTTTPASLFFSAADQKAQNNQDGEFLAHGYTTPPLTARQQASTPNPNHPSNLIFKLRSLYGCNSRAEIIAWLLTHPSGHPAQIARDIHYFNKSVQTTLNEMTASGLIQHHQADREKHFRLDHPTWCTFLNIEPPQSRNWAELFTTIQLFDQALATASRQKHSLLLTASQLHQTYLQHPFTQSLISLHQTDPKNYETTITTTLTKHLN